MEIRKIRMSFKHTLWRAIARTLTVGRKETPLRPGLRILGYHSIGTTIPGDPYGLSTSAATFTRQMAMIATGRFGQPASFSSAVIDHAHNRLAITFDDGYGDALTTIAPIMEKLGIPYAVCVTPGLISSGRSYLSWKELAELSRAPGCEIGAHGHTHARLDRLDDKALARELTQSRKRIEDAIGKAVSVMTWPHGAASRRTAEAARGAGFVRGACSLYGLNTPSRDPLLLKRVEIVGFDNERDFIQKCSGDWDWYSVRQTDPATA
jgi:peptidoglycan/xylan/chitin deacetylase (PgdA/CDA1 family)